MNHAAIITQTNRTCADINKMIRRALGRTGALQKGDLLLVTQNNYMADLVNGDLVKVMGVGGKEDKCNMTFRKVEVMELASKQKYSLLLIENILNSLTTNLNNHQHRDLLIDYYYRMKALGISQESDDFKLKMLTDPYLNALKSVYGYALTCHKGQGGEWNEVFLYMDNKIHGIPKPSIYQWVYTAVTRAKEHLHVVDDWFISQGR